MSVETELDAVKEVVERTHSRVRAISEVIWGDGLREPGLLIRIDRVERVSSTVVRLLWAVALGVGALLGSRIWEVIH